MRQEYPSYQTCFENQTLCTNLGCVIISSVMKFRFDIEGLRGLAIMMAISFHLGVPYLQGGFVSVDMFFVISGFLITSLLAGEFAKSHANNPEHGTVSLKNFYVRRVRRILPVAVFIIALTVSLGFLLFNPLRSKLILNNGIWALLFGANINAINQTTDYFQEGLPTSPLLHYWSLAVEEQFYFFWPLLFILSARNVFRVPFFRALSWERRVFAIISLIGVASYCWSIYATYENPKAAYFSTFTRTFELATGAAVAILVRIYPNISPSIKQIFSYVAIALIAGTALTYPNLRGFPGYLGILPTLATALYLVAGIPSNNAPQPFPNRFLSKNPWKLLGTISYSMYLWHFPLILALKDFNPSAGKTGLSMCLILLTIILLATITFYVIEKPCRIVSAHHQIDTSLDPLFSGTWFKKLFVAASGLCVAAGLIMVVVTEHPIESTNVARSSVDKTHPQTVVTSRTLSPLLPDEEKLMNSWHSKVTEGVGLTFLPPNLIPLQPHLQKPIGLVAPCHDTSNPRYPLDHLDECTIGDPDAPKSIAIVGDSRAGAWVQALKGALNAKEWKIYPFTRGHSCGWSFTSPGAPTSFNCPGIIDDTIERLNELRPDAIILTEVGFGDRNSFRAAIQRYLSASPKIIVLSSLQGLPTFEECLGKDNSIGKCPVKMFNNAGDELRAGVSDVVTIADVTHLLCHEQVCAAVIDGTPVFYDGNHFSFDMADKLSQPLKVILRQLGIL